MGIVSAIRNVRRILKGERPATKVVVATDDMVGEDVILDGDTALVIPPDLKGTIPSVVATGDLTIHAHSPCHLPGRIETSGNLRLLVPSRGERVRSRIVVGGNLDLVDDRRPVPELATVGGFVLTWTTEVEIATMTHDGTVGRGWCLHGPVDPMAIPAGYSLVEYPDPATLSALRIHRRAPCHLLVSDAFMDRYRDLDANGGVGRGRGPRRGRSEGQSVRVAPPVDMFGPGKGGGHLRHSRMGR